jgi:hypothetical protein
VRSSVPGIRGIASAEFAGGSSNIQSLDFGIADALLGRIIEALDIALPLLLVHAVESTVVRQEAVDLALDVCGLSPDGARAGVELDLLLQFAQEVVGAHVPDVDGSG